LRSVRETAADPHAGYVMRIRLRRALLSITRTICRAHGLKEPIFPARLHVPARAGSELTALAEACNHAYAHAEHLCQPSEAFDARWRAEWGELDDVLARLEQLLDGGPPPTEPR
jgi:hypothetical protein